jgi:hypothetical protein
MAITRRRPQAIKVKFDLPDTNPELQFLGVLAQVGDLFAHSLTHEQMARVVTWFHAKYTESKPDGR